MSSQPSEEHGVSGQTSTSAQAPQQTLPVQPRKKRNKLLVGCGGLVGLLLFCAVINAISSAISGGKDNPQANGTAVPAAANNQSTVSATSTVAGNQSVQTAPQPTQATVPPTQAAAKPTQAAPQPTQAKPPTTVKAYKKGETATLEGQKVTLNEVAKNGTTYVADVTVENTGAKQANVSSLISFDARDALGNKGDFKFTESKGLDGPVDPNGKLRGTIGFDFPAEAKGIKLYYSAAAFTGQPIVFALDDAAAEQPFPPHPIATDAKPLNQATTYKAGDVIKIGDLVIKLENVTKQGTFVTADLVAYNAGGKVVNLSSLLSFTGQDSTGKKGDFKLPDKAGFDGTLLPGDSLKGQIRLEFDAGATGITLTYRPSAFGGQAVKWALD